MLLLTTTSDEIRVATDSAATVDVHASFADRAAGVDTGGNQNTAISSATSTTVVSPPAGATVRNIRRLRVRNKHASLSVTVTVSLYNGTDYELEKRVLGPGAALEFNDQAGFFPIPTGGVQTRPWFGQLAGCFADGDPGHLLYEVQRAGTIAATPTNITASIARCSAFTLPFDMTVNTIRFYGVGAPTANLFQVAIYRMSDLARLIAAQGMSPAANTWGSVGGALGLSLLKDTCYFIACAVTTTGTTAGPVCMGSTVAATTGQIATAPGSLPGRMALGATNYMGGYQFQFAVAAGVLPDPAATLAAQAAWVGGMPAFWLDAT